MPGDPYGSDPVLQPEASYGGCREVGHPRGMAEQPRALQVHEVTEGSRDRLDLVVVDEAGRVWLDGEHLLVRVHHVEVFEQLGGPTQEHVTKTRVQLSARTAPHRHDSGVRTRPEREQDGGRGDVGDAGAEGNRLAGRGGVPLAGPHGGEVEQAVPDRVRQAEPASRVPGDLAGRDRRDGVNLLAGSDRGGQDTRPGLPGGLRHTGNPGTPHVLRLGEVRQQGHPDRRDVVTPHPGALVRVRRASQVLEERGVDDVADLRVRAPGGSCEAHRDEAPLERLLHGRTRAEVGGDGQAAEESQHAKHTATLAHTPATLPRGLWESGKAKPRPKLCPRSRSLVPAGAHAAGPDVLDLPVVEEGRMGPPCVQGADDLFGPPSGKPVDGRRRLATPSRFSEQPAVDQASGRNGRAPSMASPGRSGSRCDGSAEAVGLPTLPWLRVSARRRVFTLLLGGPPRETSRPIYAHAWDGTRGSRWAHCAAAKAPSTA